MAIRILARRRDRGTEPRNKDRSLRLFCFIFFV